MMKNLKMSTERQSQAFRRIERIEDTFRVLSEFGLFAKDQQHAQVLESITVARMLAEEGKEPEALDVATRGELIINRVLISKGRFWRCIFLHQFPLFTYHIIFFLVLLNIATGWFSFTSPQIWSSISVPMSALVAGGFGAVLRGIWFLWLKVSRREFRIQFTLAQLAAPWVGMLLGIFSFLLLKAGILLVEGSKQGTVKTSEFELAVCFLAGYKWESLLDWVDRVKLRSSGDSVSG